MNYLLCLCYAVASALLNAIAGLDHTVWVIRSHITSKHINRSQQLCYDALGGRFYYLLHRERETRIDRCEQ